MSEYTRKRLADLKEGAETFRKAGLIWASRKCQREYEILDKKIKDGTVN